MSSYANRMNAFSGSIADNQGMVNNYLAEKKGVAVENKQGFAQARAEAIAHTTGEFIKGAGFEGAIRAGKPVLGKALKWLDTKTGFSRKVDELAGLKPNPTSVATTGSEEGQTLAKTVAKPLGGSNVGEGRQMMEIKTKLPSNQYNRDGFDSKTGLKSDPKPDPTTGETKSNFKPSDDGYGEDGAYDGMNSGEVKSSAGEVKSSAMDNMTETKNNLSSMGDDLDEGAQNLKSGLSDTITGLEDGVKSGAENIAKKIGGGIAETAGDLLDATGVGAIVGIPLQLAGVALEGAGVYEAGKTVVDWFKQDILGDKPKVTYTGIAQPKQVATLAGIGAQATPTFSTTMDVPGGSGSW